MADNTNADSQNSGKKAVKTVFIMIMATLLSKALGMFRNIFLTGQYSLGEEFAAFTTANKIPSSFFEILLGAVIAGVFIPFYNSYKKDSEEQQEFSDIFLSFILILTSVISFFGVIFSKQIILFIAPSYADAENIYMFTLASDFLKILFPSMMFTGATYTLVGVLQSRDEFLVPAFISSISNAGIIIYFLFLNRYFGIYGVCAAYTVSWAIQFATLIYPLYKKGFKYKFKVNFKNKEFFGSLKMYLPVLVGSWFIPVGDLLGNSFASGCTDNAAAVSSFGLARDLFLLITGIFTYGICNYIFPKLSRLSASEENQEEYGNVVKTGISVALFIIVPVTLISYFLKSEIITIVYVRGKFTAQDAEYMMKFFNFFVPAMLFFSLNEVMTRIFYSKKKMFAPMAATFCGIGLNYILNYIFFNILSLPARYIALANSLGQLAILIVLIIFFIKYFYGILNFHFILNLTKIIISAALTFAALTLLENTAVKNINTGSTLTILIYCAVTAAITLIIYSFVNFLLKTNEIKEALAMINKRSKSAENE